MCLEEFISTLRETISFGKFKNYSVEQVLSERPEYIEYLEEQQGQVGRMIEVLKKWRFIESRQ